MKSCITISLVPSLKGGPWVLWGNLEKCVRDAARLGFDSVELFTDGPHVENHEEFSILLEETGLSVGAVGTGAGKVLHGLTLTHRSKEIRLKALAFIHEMIEFGAKYNAPAIIGSMQGSHGDGVTREQALDWLGHSLQELGQHAHNEGVTLIYEPLNRYETNLFNLYLETCDFIDHLSTNGVSLLADLFHMNIEEENIAESIKANANKLGHVHFADSNRRPIGYGHTEIEPISRCIKEIGYSGYVSAEAFAWPDPVAAAQKTIDSFRKFFQ